MTIYPNSSHGMTGQRYPVPARRTDRAILAGQFNRLNEFFIQVAVGIAEGEHLVALLVLQVRARALDLDPTLFFGETGESRVGTSMRPELDAISIPFTHLVPTQDLEHLRIVAGRNLGYIRLEQDAWVHQVRHEKHGSYESTTFQYGKRRRVVVDILVVEGDDDDSLPFLYFVRRELSHRH